MAVKKIYVREGDAVIVHVIRKDVPEEYDFGTNRETWKCGSADPVSYLFLAEYYGPKFTDPQFRTVYDGSKNNEH